MIRIKTFLALLCFALPSFATAKADISVYFTPSEDCKKNIIQHIEQAENSIDIAIFSFTDRNIANSLQKAAAKGINIRLLTDKEQSDFHNSVIHNLIKKGINVRYNVTQKQEHNKFAVFDNKIVSTGSFNWTYRASYYNSENCLFIDKEAKVADKYKIRFNQLWAKAETAAEKKRKDKRERLK